MKLSRRVVTAIFLCFHLLSHGLEVSLHPVNSYASLVSFLSLLSDLKPALRWQVRGENQDILSQWLEDVLQSYTDADDGPAD